MKRRLLFKRIAAIAAAVVVAPAVTVEAAPEVDVLTYDDLRNARELLTRSDSHIEVNARMMDAWMRGFPTDVNHYQTVDTQKFEISVGFVDWKHMPDFYAED